MTIQTSPNILTLIEITLTGYNIKRQRWEITYNISQTNLIEGKTTHIITNRTIVILPEEMVEWMASWDGVDSLIDVSFQKVIAREKITQWDETIIDDIETAPDAEEIKPWTIGELVAAPNRRSYKGKVYVVIQPHRCLPNWTPDVAPALWNYLFDEDNGGEGLQPWIQPTGAHNSYALDAQTAHNGLCWQSAVANNVWQPGAPGIGSNIWFEIPCP